MVTGSRDQLEKLALAAALLPLLTFNITYWIAASLGHVQTCFTYLEGCTSVSSTGRTPPEFWIFKAGVLSLALVLALHWRNTAAFLAANGVALSRRRLLLGLAYTSVVALSIYAVTLGLPDEHFGRIRRVGTHGFAFTSWLTQIVFVLTYRPLRIAATTTLFQWLLAASLALLFVGVLSEIAKATGTPRKVTNNIAAWNAFLMLSGFYFLLSRIWRRHSKSAGRAASPSE